MVSSSFYKNKKQNFPAIPASTGYNRNRQLSPILTKPKRKKPKNVVRNSKSMIADRPARHIKDLLTLRMNSTPFQTPRKNYATNQPVRKPRKVIKPIPGNRPLGREIAAITATPRTNPGGTTRTEQPSRIRQAHSRQSSYTDKPQQSFDAIVSPKDIPEPVLRMTRVIGKGTWGKVYLATLDIEVWAAKVVELRSQNLIKYIRNEQEVLKKVDHELIVQYKKFVEQPQSLCLCMEYIENGDLFHKMRRRKLTRKEIIFVSAEIILALNYLHSLNIIYRDLKPENIMITYSGHIKLIDFGLSKILKKETDRTYTVVGSPDYIAPEILQRQGYGPQVDFWSLGVLIYELFTGVTPFKSDSAQDTYKRITAGSYQFSSSLDVVAKDLIRQLLVPVPTARPMGQQIKRHEFFDGIDWLDFRHWKTPCWPMESDFPSGFHNEKPLF